MADKIRKRSCSSYVRELGGYRHKCYKPRGHTGQHQGAMMGKTIYWDKIG